MSRSHVGPSSLPFQWPHHSLRRSKRPLQVSSGRASMWIDTAWLALGAPS